MPAAHAQIVIDVLRQLKRPGNMRRNHQSNVNADWGDGGNMGIPLLNADSGARGKIGLLLLKGP